MSQEEIRQSKSEQAVNVRSNGRITRGFSNLPKEEPKVESSSSEEEEEQESESLPKTKKIHHMTLKAMERRKQLQQQMEKQGIKPEDLKVVEKAPPKKRGRPKGSSKKLMSREDKQDYHAELSEQMVDEQEQAGEKKELNLRKRDNAKKLIEPESEENAQREEQEQEIVKGVEVIIEVPVKVNIVKKQEEVVSAQSVPKKRGRKKKVQVQAQPGVAPLAPAPLSKIYTVPKAQTYDNYLKYYDKLLSQTKEGSKPQAALIFDRFSDEQAYRRLLSQLRFG